MRLPATIIIGAAALLGAAPPSRAQDEAIRSSPEEFLPKKP
jgi:hypothetical protein